MIGLELRRWFRDPLFLLALAAGLIAFVVQSGELGTSDTQHRLQTTHSWWTAEPPVFPQEYPEFGVHGRGGKLQSWYGIGQSLLMLPADVVGTYVARLPIFAAYDDTDPTVRAIIVSYSTNVLVTVLTALVCFRFLRQLEFDVRQAVVGVLALLLSTTHLHYTQNMMENNYIFLLTLTGLSFQYEWLRSGSRRALLLGSCAFGLNLLTRLTTGMDLLAGALFLLLAAWLEKMHASWAAVCDLRRNRCSRLLIICVPRSPLPVRALWAVLQHLPGSGCSRTEGARSIASPRLSVQHAFPHRLLGAVLCAGEVDLSLRSVIAAHAYALLACLEAIHSRGQGLCLMSGVLLLAYISFYARVVFWSGDSAWGDRYVSTTVELAALLAVPLLLRHRRHWDRVWVVGSR